jgi:hypothetical protein
MALSLDIERQLAALVADIREQLAALGPAHEEAALRRLVTLLRAPGKVVDRERIRERARMMATQAGKCAVCFVAFADTPPATRSGVTDRLLCGPCARESHIPSPR